MIISFSVSLAVQKIIGTIAVSGFDFMMPASCIPEISPIIISSMTRSNADRS